ncbi:MAG: hypothetical protein K9I94_07830 [Bacteroidales bacterium]|nr:hypothetical protein [Bacteroidales bacterium]
MKQILLLILTILITGACSTREKVIAEKFPDGSPKIIEIYEGSDQDKTLVKRIAYYDNEHKRVEGQFKNGEKNGQWTYWYESGHKWSEGYFKDGKSHGMRTVWHENGNKYIEGEYRKGKRIGKWKFWNEQGELIKTKDYGLPEE